MTQTAIGDYALRAACSRYVTGEPPEAPIPLDRLKAAEEFVRDELRIMGQVEDEALIKRVAETIARRMEGVNRG